MLHQKFALKLPGSLPESCFITYILDDSPEIGIEKRPVVIVCPGGGYRFLSDREGEILALQFCARGYHAVILKYSVAPACYPTALLEMATVVKTLRENAEEWHIDTDKIIVNGSSAGGHLAASYGVFWTESFIAETVGAEKEQLRPNGMLLNYPVISSGEFAHRDSFVALLGERYDELVDKMSLENQVNADTPKTFVWHTFEDGLVPPENSLLLVSALRRQGIQTEFHLFPAGGHGLSLATRLTAMPGGNEIQPECACWIDLAGAWIENL